MGRSMKLKLLIMTTWLSYYAVLRTADGVWLFFTIYSGILAICLYLYSLENTTPKKKKKRK